MAKKTLSILIAHYRPDIVSGAENSIADFVSQADERFRFTMLVPGEGKLADFFRQRGFDVWVHRVEGPRRLAPGLHTLQSLWLSGQLKRREYAAVLCNTFPAASRVATASRMAKIPYAIYMRDYLTDEPLHRQMLDQANALFAISKDVIRRHLAMTSPMQFRLTYNYIHPDPILDRYEAHLASGARLLPFPPSQPVIGLVGRITPYKQPDLFIRAAPMVLERVPDARFALVGAAQERERGYEEQIKALARSLGVAEQVAFLGQRRDAVELTSEFAIACLTSGREPLGRVILEAQLMGVPVIAPATGGPAEIVKDEVTGLHFSSQSEDAASQLAEKIIRLLTDRDQRDCLSQKGRERVQSHFASRKNIQIQEEYIEELCCQG